MHDDVHRMEAELRGIALDAAVLRNRIDYRIVFGTTEKGLGLQNRVWDYRIGFGTTE